MSKRHSITFMRRSVRRHIAKIPHNIFKKPELELEEEEAPPPWVVRVGATSKGEEWRWKGGLGTVGRKRLMCHILIEPLMCHHLDHAHNLRSESTRSLRVDSNVPYLINDVVEGIKVLILHDSIKKVPLIGRYGI
jgi:hypothetical protein